MCGYKKRGQRTKREVQVGKAPASNDVVGNRHEGREQNHVCNGKGNLDYACQRDEHTFALHVNCEAGAVSGKGRGRQALEGGEEGKGVGSLSSTARRVQVKRVGWEWGASRKDGHERVV